MDFTSFKLNLQLFCLILNSIPGILFSLKHSLSHIDSESILQHLEYLLLGLSFFEIVGAFGFDIEIGEEFASLHFLDN